MGLKPGRVKGTHKILFTKGRNPELEIIDWGEFEEELLRKKYE